MSNTYILDAFSSNVRLQFFDDLTFFNCEFVGDEECIFVKSVQPIGGRLELFNVRSGDLLSVMDVEWNVSCWSCVLASCPRMGLIAICSRKPQFNFEIIKVKHSREETLNTETKM